METTTATKVTVYTGESDRYGGRPLYMAILELLKREECAGATVTRGLAGFGAGSGGRSRIRTATIVDLSPDLPLVVEWVDDPARVARLMPRLAEMVGEGIITVQSVEVVSHGPRAARRGAGGDVNAAHATVGGVMSRDVHTVGPHTGIAEAVEMLTGKAYKALPVVDAERQVVGILTSGDVLSRLGLPQAGVQAALTEAELARELESLRHGGGHVGDIMVSPAVTIGEDVSLQDAARTMAARGIKRLPVVDAEGRLVGIISRVDVLRALARPTEDVPAPGPVAPAIHPGRHAKAGDVMQVHVPAVSAAAPLNEVAGLLVAAPHRRIVVVDAERRVLGIITDGDLLQRASATERTGLLAALFRRRAPVDLDLAGRTAAEVMTPDPVTVTPETPLLDALQLLLLHRIKRLPVVDAEGRLAGLLGRAEILQVLAADPESPDLGTAAASE